MQYRMCTPLQNVQAIGFIASMHFGWFEFGRSLTAHTATVCMVQQVAAWIALLLRGLQHEDADVVWVGEVLYTHVQHTVQHETRVPPAQFLRHEDRSRKNCRLDGVIITLNAWCNHVPCRHHEHDMNKREDAAVMSKLASE